MRLIWTQRASSKTGTRPRECLNLQSLDVPHTTGLFFYQHTVRTWQSEMGTFWRTLLLHWTLFFFPFRCSSSSSSSSLCPPASSALCSSSLFLFVIFYLFLFVLSIFFVLFFFPLSCCPLVLFFLLYLNQWRNGFASATFLPLFITLMCNADYTAYFWWNFVLISLVYSHFSYFFRAFKFWFWLKQSYGSQQQLRSHENPSLITVCSRTKKNWND